MISDFSSNTGYHHNFIRRNIRRISNKPRLDLNEIKKDAQVQIGVSGVSIILNARENSHFKSALKDINDNYQKVTPRERPKQTPISNNIKYQELFSCGSSSGSSLQRRPVRKITGVRRTSIRTKGEVSGLNNIKIDETNDIILRNLRLCGECRKVTYYTYRQVFPVPVTSIPHDQSSYDGQQPFQYSQLPNSKVFFAGRFSQNDCRT